MKNSPTAKVKIPTQQRRDLLLLREDIGVMGEGDGTDDVSWEYSMVEFCIGGSVSIVGMDTLLLVLRI